MARIIETYTDTCKQLAAFAGPHGRAESDRALIEDYLADHGKTPTSDSRPLADDHWGARRTTDYLLRGVEGRRWRATS